MCMSHADMCEQKVIQLNELVCPQCTNPINNLYAISDILVSEGSISPVINRCCAGALALAFFFIRLLYAPLGREV